MDARDLDRLARLVATSCSRRQTLKVLGAGAMALGLGRRARFDALAADLGCCKCSGTLRCEMDVATYGECKTLCGPRKQAIFAPNYTCTRGNSLSKVCKPKRRATGAVLLAGAPGVYDLAFVDRAGAATIPGLAPVTTEALFTTEAAIAAGFVGEAGAAVLFEGGVQVYHSLWQDAGDTIAVIDQLSQHLTAEAAATFFEYALAQLQPDGAETFELELSGIDAGALFRFAFASQTRPGATITRLMAITLTGEFVNWVGIDGVDTVPDPEVGRTFAQAIVDALIDRPEQTASLAPYVALLPEARACLPAFPAAAKRAGANAARGPARFQDEDAACGAPTGTIRYAVWDEAYVPVLGASESQIKLNQRFFTGADRVLNQSYVVGDQTRTITITFWNDPDVLANNGEVLFGRQAEVDEARRAIRQDIDGGGEGWSWSTFAIEAGEQTIYGVDAVGLLPPYSLSLGVVAPGEPLSEQESWATDGRIPLDAELQAALEEMGQAFDDWKRYFAEGGDLPVSAIYNPGFPLPEDDDPPLLLDFGAATASLALSPAMDGFAVTGDLTILTAEAATRWQLHDEGVNKRLFDDWGLLQERHDTFVVDNPAAWFRLAQYQFPDANRAAAGYEELRQTLSYATAEDLRVAIAGQTQGAGYQFPFQTAEGENIYRVNTVIQAGEIVVTSTHDVSFTGETPTDATETSRSALEVIWEWYNSLGSGNAVGDAAQTVTPYMPLVEGLDSYRYNFGFVGGQRLPRYGVDADRIAAENPGVEHALFGSYGLNSGLGPIQVYFGSKSFLRQRDADDYVEQLPELMLNNGSGVKWRPTDDLTLDLGVPYFAHRGTWTPEVGTNLVCAHGAIQNERIVFDIGACVPFTDDEEAFAELERNPLVDTSFFWLGQGVADLTSQLYSGRASDPEREYEGYLPSRRYAVPRAWQPYDPYDLLDSDEADPTLLRDFGATAASLALTPEFLGWGIAGGTTVLSPRAATEYEFYAGELSRRLAGKGLQRAHRDTFYSDDGSERLDVTQLQFPNPDSAAAALDELFQAFRYAGGEDFLWTIPGATSVIGNRFAFQTEEGANIYRVNMAAQVNEFAVTITHDNYNYYNASQFTWESPEDAPDEIRTSLTYFVDNLGGTHEFKDGVGDAAQAVTPYLPLVKGVDAFQYSYGFVSDQWVPRYGVDPDQIAAENPGVEHALIGNYALPEGGAPLRVYFGVRSFADQGASDAYWALLPELMLNNSSGVNWRFAGEYADIEVPSLEHVGTWPLDESLNLVGAHGAFQIGTIVLDIGAFATYTGNPAAFAALKPLDDPVNAQIRAGLYELAEEMLGGESVTEWATRQGFLPIGRYDVPERWLSVNWNTDSWQLGND